MVGEGPRRAKAMGMSEFPLLCRVISRAQGLKLVVETLMSSLKPIGNIVVICCAFFIIFGILGVQVCQGGEIGGWVCLRKAQESPLSSWLPGSRYCHRCSK